MFARLDNVHSRASFRLFRAGTVRQFRPLESVEDPQISGAGSPLQSEKVQSRKMALSGALHVEPTVFNNRSQTQ
jgi:hypothetical protein